MSESISTKQLPSGVISTKVSVRLFSLKSVSCTATILATIATTLTLSGLNFVFPFSSLERWSMASTRRERRLLSDTMFSKRSSSAGKIPSWIASTVAMIAISGVLSSCATSLVRRRSSLMSLSSEDAMSSKVSPRRPSSFSPRMPERAARLPLLI